MIRYQLLSYSRNTQHFLVPAGSLLCSHNGPSLVPIVSHMNLTHTLPSCSCKTHFNIIIPPLPPTPRCFHQSLSSKTLYTLPSQVCCMPCPAHFIHLNLIFLISDELLSTLFSSILSPCSSLNVRYQDPSITATKILVLVCFHFYPLRQHTSYEKILN